MDELKKQLKAAGATQFGSGWAWLVKVRSSCLFRRLQGMFICGGRSSLSALMRVPEQGGRRHAWVLGC